MVYWDRRGTFFELERKGYKVYFLIIIRMKKSVIIISVFVVCFIFMLNSVLAYQEISFDSTGVTIQNVTVQGQIYTIELVSASYNTATISVTASDGTMEQKDIGEGYAPKIINGIQIYVKSADSNNQRYTATIQVSAYTPAPAPTPTPVPPTPTPNPTPSPNPTPNDEINLNSNNPSTIVNIDNNNYTIELVSASVNSATISVIASDGTTEQKDISVGTSKSIGGISIYLKSANSNNQGYNAVIIAKPIIQNGECNPVGLRKDKKYCSFDTKWIDQKKTDISCDNNFECESNLCINSKCFSGSLWDKIARWFSNLFGGK